jgi:hypothetical protein
MFTDWLERRRLVRKGLACDKTRLSHSGDSLPSRADGSWQLRLFILCFFIALLNVGVAWGRPVQNLEDQILAFIVFVSGLMLLELDCPDVWRSNSRLVLILGTIWFNLVMVKGLYLALPTLDPASMVFLSPCAFAAFVITLLLGARVGLFSVVQVSMLASLLIDRNFIFLLVSLLSGFTAVYFSQNIRKPRSSGRAEQSWPPGVLRARRQNRNGAGDLHAHPHRHGLGGQRDPAPGGGSVPDHHHDFLA